MHPGLPLINQALGLGFLCLALMSGCSESSVRNPAGEMTVILTDELRLEKTDATRVFLVDSRGRKKIDAIVTGIAATKDSVFLKCVHSDNSLSYARLEITTGRLSVTNDVGSLALAGRTAFRDMDHLIASKQIEKVGLDTYRFRLGD